MVAQQTRTEVRTEHQALESHFGFVSPISTLAASEMSMSETFFFVLGVFCPCISKVVLGLVSSTGELKLRKFSWAS